MSGKPALLNSGQVLQERVSIVRPTLPDFRELAFGFEDMISTGMLTTGPYLQEFEEAVADHLGTRHAVAVSSCTTGLALTYRNMGLSGDVIIPSFTFMATASALIWANLRPVFADVDWHTHTLDAASVEAAITPNTTAIVAVHTFGNPADFAALESISKRHGLKLIFDAAHGFGARYQGRPVGPQGDAQIYSLSPTKLLVAGEGGIVATNHDDLANAIRLGREYGKSGDYDSAFAGMNARMSELHALMGLRGLPQLEAAANRRNEIAECYQDALGALPGISFQQIRSGDRCSYKDLSITVEPSAFGITRDELALALEAENIDSRKYYDPPVHMQTAYRDFAAVEGRLSNTVSLSACSLSLPIWSHMPDSIVKRICRSIRCIHEHSVEVKKELRASTRSAA